MFVPAKLFQPSLTNTSLVQKFINYGLKQFHYIGPRSWKDTLTQILIVRSWQTVLLIQKQKPTFIVWRSLKKVCRSKHSLAYFASPSVTKNKSFYYVDVSTLSSCCSKESKLYLKCIRSFFCSYLVWSERSLEQSLTRVLLS